MVLSYPRPGLCDSVVTYAFTYLPYQQAKVVLEKCANETLFYRNHIFKDTGSFKDTVANSLGCDSVITYYIKNSNSFRFKIAASSTIKYLEIQNFNSGDNPILYDLTNSFRLEATVESGIVKVALPPSPTLRELILVNGNELNQVGDFEDTNFINYWEVEGNFIMISHPALFDDGSGKNWVQNYADYRRSTAGGNYESIIVDINQLYEQFSYGVKRHSISIRNFGHFIKKNWSNPKYVFLVGKARQYPDVRSKDQLADQYLKNF